MMDFGVHYSGLMLMVSSLTVHFMLFVSIFSKLLSWLLNVNVSKVGLSGQCLWNIVLDILFKCTIAVSCESHILLLYIFSRMGRMVIDSI